MATVSDVLGIAGNEVDYDRFNDPQRGTKYGRWFASLMGSSYYGQNGVPFCAMFVSWVLAQAGVKCEGFPSACAFSGSNQFNGRRIAAEDLQAGDVVNFDWDGDNGGDHVGIVESVISTGVYRTIEGNVDGGKVKRCTRYASQIICGIRPYYSGSSAATLIIDGIVGAATVAAWQKQIGRTVLDGVISGQQKEHDRYRRSVYAISYGGAGSALVLKVQKRVGANVDGDWGKDTTIHLQQTLKRWGYYGGGIDGDFGPASAKALQQSINAGEWAE